MKGALLLTVAAVLVGQTSGVFFLSCLWDTCSQHCSPTFFSYYCWCDPGFVLNPTDEKTCDPLGPCPPGNECQQNCFNLGSEGRRCSCNDGYVVNAKNPNKCDAIRACSTIVDIVFAFPNSATAGGNNFKQLLSYLVKLVSHNPVANTRARYAAYGYGSTILPAFALKDYKTSAEVQAKLTSTPFQNGKAPVEDVLEFLVANQVFSTPNGGRSNAPNVLVVFFDGPITDRAKAQAAVNNLKNVANARIIAVAIGKDVSLPDARSLSTGNNDAFWVSSYPGLDKIENDVASHLC